MLPAKTGAADVLHLEPLTSSCRAARATPAAPTKDRLPQQQPALKAGRAQRRPGHTCTQNTRTRTYTHCLAPSTTSQRAPGLDQGCPRGAPPLCSAPLRSGRSLAAAALPRHAPLRSLPGPANALQLATLLLAPKIAHSCHPASARSNPRPNSLRSTAVRPRRSRLLSLTLEPSCPAAPSRGGRVRLNRSPAAPLVQLLRVVLRVLLRAIGGWVRKGGQGRVGSASLGSGGFLPGAALDADPLGGLGHGPRRGPGSRGPLGPAGPGRSAQRREAGQGRGGGPGPCYAHSSSAGAGSSRQRWRCPGACVHPACARPAPAAHLEAGRHDGHAQLP
jgi:hypothetical protein